MLRGRLAWLVTLPKSESVGSRKGLLNCGWLKAFRNSPRSCSLTLSLKEKDLISETSQRLRGCPRNLEKCDGRVRILDASLMRGSLRCFEGSGTPVGCPVMGLVNCTAASAK